VIDIASVGAITPIDTESVASWPSSRLSLRTRVGCGAAVVVGGATAPMGDSNPRAFGDSTVPAGYGWRAMRGLEGKRALVTGAARGIGLATAQRLAGEGARVALLDVDGDALAEATAAVGADALALHADVRDEDAVRGAIERAMDALGGLDVVVPNAAIQLVGADDRADRLDRAVWQETVDVNLTGAFLAAKHGARALLAAGSGAIVFIASPAGTHGIARGLQAYSASKAGVVGLVRAMAADYAGEAIRVNGVLPGITETPMNRWWTEDPALREQVLAPVPLGRAARAEEIAAVAAFLASDDASYVTGALWTVDGGLTAV
jgi:NAD(P)-dependent dehydrogenase (short-subunit alcohol dehydrogenase family)